MGGCHLSESADDYQSYLPRLWKDEDDEQADWRASLEDSSSGEIEGFQDLQGLFESLRDRTRIKQDEQDDG
jgi:hypothetical protein